MAATNGMNITVFGRGGHGSAPHLGASPVVLARSIVMRLHTIVSREVPTNQLAVVTVGAIHAGSAENIISNEAVLKVNTRSVESKWKENFLSAFERIVCAECEASRSQKLPQFTRTSSTEVVDNDDAVTARLSESFAQHFGTQFDPSTSIIPASEDFNQLGIAIDRPYCFLSIGAHDAEDWDRRGREGESAGVTGLQTPYFVPSLSTTLRTGVEAMAIAALIFIA